MRKAHTVTLAGVVSGGWFTGTIARGEAARAGRMRDRRPVTCRVEDAPEEIAELIAWAMKPDLLHPTFDW
jgi:hypothetical protein